MLFDENNIIFHVICFFTSFFSQHNFHVPLLSIISLAFLVKYAPTKSRIIKIHHPKATTIQKQQQFLFIAVGTNNGDSAVA
jgi:accessory gene regulator protein AgrB